MIERDEQSTRLLEQLTSAGPENVHAAAGRRRFLKGLGIGLPAVMTLRSGALMAATSSQCLANRTPTANFLPPTAPAFNTSDTWVRQSSPSYTAVEYSNGTNTVWIVNVGGFDYDATSGAVFDLTGYTATGNTQSNYLSLCYVDQTGNVVSVDCNPASPNNGLAANASCATSFMINP